MQRKERHSKFPDKCKDWDATKLFRQKKKCDGSEWHKLILVISPQYMYLYQCDSSSTFLTYFGCTMILKPHYAPINAAPLPTTWIRDTFSWEYDCISLKNWKRKPCVERALLGLHIVDGAQTMSSFKKAYNMKNLTMNFSWYIVYDLVEQLKNLWINLPSLNISYTS